MQAFGHHLLRRRLITLGAEPSVYLSRAFLQLPAGVRDLSFIPVTRAIGHHRSSARVVQRSGNLLTGTRRASNYTPDLGPITQELPKPRRSLFVRILINTGLFVVFTTFGFYMAAGEIVQTFKELGNTPTDEETLLLVDPLPEDPAHEVNETIMHHPLARSLFSDTKFIAARPHMKIPKTIRVHNFTGGTLTGPDKMPVPPLVFSTTNGTELVQIQYLGSALCGHPGLVHGGMLATLLDEGLARCCFPGLPNKVAVTASLKVDYRKPCAANQYVVMKCETTKFEGRKAWVKGRIETLPLDGSQGDVLVEAEALFIEPRNAALLASQRKILETN